MGNLKSPIPAPEVTLSQQPHTSVVAADSVAWPDFVGISVPIGCSTLCFVPGPTMENMRQYLS
ncbi:hypothetical protein T05_12582 [Trichinella murrelli]|uniref:Uncharacterized protein n=1 Tax=Trichinella murrelli TaxID=144512 RepID=A0A0V0T6I8_9BILA|nr:hypothetical protein T05_12582 [Trichinella murrelli]